MKKTVVYISSCALNAEGKPDPFFLQELPWLRKHFDRVVMCSSYGVAEIAEDRPVRIAASRPAYGALRACLQAPFHRMFLAELNHLRADGRLSVQNALKLLFFTVRGLKMHHWIQAVLHGGEQTTLYAYWMSFDGFAAALGKQKDARIRAIARAHAFDIDVQRNPMNPYLMKRFMARTLDSVYPISRYALDQMITYSGISLSKLSVVGVGSVGKETGRRFTAPRFKDGVFHLVSCSAMIDVKQLPLLIDTLAKWQSGKLRWTHIGGGSDETTIHALAKEKLEKNSLFAYEFTGALQPEQLRSLYETKPFDAFINTSRSEGIPVTIMEALHEGIPVVAPCIGGIPELIDESVGFLYQKDGGADAVLAALLSIARQTPEETEQMREAAHMRWKERCELCRLLPLIFPDETEVNTAS